MTVRNRREITCWLSSPGRLPGEGRMRIGPLRIEDSRHPPRQRRMCEQMCGRQARYVRSFLLPKAN